jgi:hypothetical protein
MLKGNADDEAFYILRTCKGVRRPADAFFTKITHRNDVDRRLGRV